MQWGIHVVLRAGIFSMRNLPAFFDRLRSGQKSVILEQK
jgi:hypothetical protein